MISLQRKSAWTNFNLLIYTRRTTEFVTEQFIFSHMYLGLITIFDWNLDHAMKEFLKIRWIDQIFIEQRYKHNSTTGFLLVINLPKLPLHVSSTLFWDKTLLNDSPGTIGMVRCRLWETVITAEVDCAVTTY